MTRAPRLEVSIPMLIQDSAGAPRLCAPAADPRTLRLALRDAGRSDPWYGGASIMYTDARRRAAVRFGGSLRVVCPCVSLRDFARLWYICRLCETLPIAEALYICICTHARTHARADGRPVAYERLANLPLSSSYRLGPSATRLRWETGGELGRGGSGISERRAMVWYSERVHRPAQPGFALVRPEIRTRSSQATTAMRARATRSPCTDVTHAGTARRRSLDRGALRRARVEPRVDSMRGRFCSLAPAACVCLHAYTPTRLHAYTPTQTHRHTDTRPHSNTPTLHRRPSLARAFVPPALGAGHAAPGAGGRRKQPYTTAHASNPSSCADPGFVSSSPAATAAMLELQTDNHSGRGTQHRVETAFKPSWMVTSAWMQYPVVRSLTRGYALYIIAVIRVVGPSDVAWAVDGLCVERSDRSHAWWVKFLLPSAAASRSVDVEMRCTGRHGASGDLHLHSAREPSPSTDEALTALRPSSLTAFSPPLGRSARGAPAAPTACCPQPMMQCDRTSGIGFFPLPLPRPPTADHSLLILQRPASDQSRAREARAWGSNSGRPHGARADLDARPPARVGHSSTNHRPPSSLHTINARADPSNTVQGTSTPAPDVGVWCSGRRASHKGTPGPGLAFRVLGQEKWAPAPALVPVSVVSPGSGFRSLTHGPPTRRNRAREEPESRGSEYPGARVGNRVIIIRWRAGQVPRSRQDRRSYGWIVGIVAESIVPMARFDGTSNCARRVTARSWWPTGRLGADALAGASAEKPASEASL
ncbi:hypothetical protein HETIRDRAFT_119466 [Heterobasidion irregulare TC 32-1]|uniref:Uncharacterized protein n=1 Tax=Heterobasidion irregulare (strain TC 32-1) TaxID=747525 RepID=W4KC86_HETIT|nr:uncharacterized protein HETIRDRAFT_119466 [Heterobasidion irregulare TC 32-1]ETW83339.1 hypothetical protein HETIRDRAFT_119466 [Heterobasidion irregulare TC 32-1]